MRIEINIDDLTFKVARDPISSAVIERELSAKAREICARHKAAMIRELDETIMKCVCVMVREEYIAASKIIITTPDETPKAEQ